MSTKGEEPKGSRLHKERNRRGKVAASSSRSSKLLRPPRRRPSLDEKDGANFQEDTHKDCKPSGTQTTAEDDPTDDTSCNSSRVVRFSIPSAKVSMGGSLRQDLIAAHLHDFYDDLRNQWDCKLRESWEAFYGKYHSPQYVMIRPSGNPLPSSGWIEMFCSKDLQVLGLELVSIDSIQILAEGQLAVVIYTVDQRFTYKGTLNEDRCLVTCVLEERNGDVRICHEHRSTGEPIPTQSRWST